MEWYWWFLIVGSILLILTIIFSAKEWDFSLFFGIYSIVCFIVFLLGLGMSMGEETAYQNIPKGKSNPYKMVIQYKVKDSLYVPMDTIFILKEKK